MLTLLEIDRLPTVQVRIKDIIEDGRLRIRYPTLDRSHVGRLRNALLTGATLPAIAIQAGTNRLIYGWHRLAAYREHDSEGTIATHILAISDAEAIRLALAENQRHGLPMRRVDLQQAASVASRYGLTDAELVQLMGVPPGKLLELRAQRGQLITRGYGPRPTFTRGAAPSGLDLLRPNQPVALQTAIPALPPSGTDDIDALTAPPAGGRCPAPGWLQRFVQQPLADLGLVEGGDVVLKQSLRHLQGLELTEAQARVARFVSASSPLSMAKQLYCLAWADALDLAAPRLLGVLRDLRSILNALDLDETAEQKAVKNPIELAALAADDLTLEDLTL